MKHSFDYDFTVQVREQVREEEAQFARFYQGIYGVALNAFVDVMFIPYFSREVKDWSLKIPYNIEIVHSMQEARLFSAALFDLIVTPDEDQAGQEELIPQLPCPRPYFDIPLDTGVIFYVTPEQFALFSQELAEIEQLTFGLYDRVRVSRISYFECIKFIQNTIITSQNFGGEKLRILGRYNETPTVFQSHYALSVNGTPIHPKEIDRNEKRELVPA